MRQEGSMYEIESTEYQDPQTGTRYRVRIVSDDDPMSPRDADNPTIMHTFDGGYHSPEDVTRKGHHDSIFPREYDCYGYGDYAERNFDLRRARKYAALDPDILAIAGLYRQPDGDLALDLDGTDEADGYIAITRESWKKCMGDAPLEGGPWLLTKTGEPDPENLEGNRTPSAQEVMQQEVEKNYNRWARGEYVGVIVEQLTTWVKAGSGAVLGGEDILTTWEEIESCWGYDDQDYARSEALSWLPDDIEEV